MKKVILNNLYESPTPPKDINLLWVDKDENSGDIINIKKYNPSKNEWENYLIQNTYPKGANIFEKSMKNLRVFYGYQNFDINEDLDDFFGFHDGYDCYLFDCKSLGLDPKYLISSNLSSPEDGGVFFFDSSINSYDAETLLVESMVAVTGIPLYGIIYAYFRDELQIAEDDIPDYMEKSFIVNNQDLKVGGEISLGKYGSMDIEEEKQSVKWDFNNYAVGAITFMGTTKMMIQDINNNF